MNEVKNITTPRWKLIKILTIIKNYVFCCCCSVTQSSLTLCDPMDYSMSGFLVLHYLLSLLKFMVVESVMPHPTLSSSVVPFSFCPQYLLASGAFPMSRLFASGGQSIGASGSVFPMNIQGCFPLGLTGLISLLFKGLSRVFSSTTVWKHQFFVSQLLYGSALTSVHDYWKSYHVFSLLIWRPLDCLKL